MALSIFFKPVVKKPVLFIRVCTGISDIVRCGHINAHDHSSHESLGARGLTLSASMSRHLLLQISHARPESPFLMPI